MGLAFQVASASSSCSWAHIWSDPRPSLAAWALPQSGWCPAGECAGGGQDILWAGVSSLPLPLPNSPSQLLGAAPSSLLEPPAVRQLMQAVIMVPGQELWFL